MPAKATQAKPRPAPKIALAVADVAIFVRTVEVSARCPKCRKSLRDVGLQHDEYQDQTREAVVAGGDVDWGNDLPEGGDSYIPLKWACGHCGHVLAEGSELRSEAP